MTDEAIRDLATRAGIAVEWHDHAGDPKIVAPEVLRRMLEALGLPCSTRGDLLASRRLLQRAIHHAGAAAADHRDRRPADPARCRRERTA